MTKFIIWLVILALVGAIGWGGYAYWEKIDNEKADAKKQAAASAVNPSTLSGLPYQLENSLSTAEAQGATALGQWLKAYGRSVQDPRLAWIELDYCVMVAKKDPQEARRIFASVKQRTPAKSPVYPRVKELAKTYE